MLIYCDTVILAYYFDHTGLFHLRATSYLGEMHKRGETIAISDLVRTEYRIKPLKNRDTAKLATFENFCYQPNVVKLLLSSDVFDRAAEIRAEYNFKLGDSLHLAAAEVGGCDKFLTNDTRLSRFTAIPIEILP